jgi:DNA-3-methyladenine glycosylase
MILPHSFYARETVTVAKELLGKYLIRNTPDGQRVGRIVETEAYLGKHDPAAHSFRGPTQRTQALFSTPGTIYIYFIYGLHYCFNVVTGVAGEGEAVLIRALEPVTGIDQPCDGPAKLVRAMGIDSALNGSDIAKGVLLITDEFKGRTSALKANDITSTPRIGISKAKDVPLRFLLKK